MLKEESLTIDELSAFVLHVYKIDVKVGFLGWAL